MGKSSGLLVRAEEYLEGPEGVSRCDKTSIQLRSHYHSVHREKTITGQIAQVSVKYSNIVISLNPLQVNLNFIRKCSVSKFIQNGGATKAPDTTAATY